MFFLWTLHSPHPPLPPPCIWFWKNQYPTVRFWGEDRVLSQLWNLRSRHCIFPTGSSQINGTQLRLGQHTLLSGALKFDQGTQRPTNRADNFSHLGYQLCNGSSSASLGETCYGNVWTQLLLRYQLGCIYSHSASLGSCFISSLVHWVFRQFHELFNICLENYLYA